MLVKRTNVASYDPNSSRMCWKFASHLFFLRFEFAMTCIETGTFVVVIKNADSTLINE